MYNKTGAIYVAVGRCVMSRGKGQRVVFVAK